MSTKLPPVPFQAQLSDSQGQLTSIWQDWFKQIFARVGKVTALSNLELAALFPVATANIANGAVSFVKLLSTDWTNSQATSGYQKLPSGLYIQWGVTSSIGSGTNTGITFPIAFPNNCFQVVPGIQGNSAGSTVATGQWGTDTYSKTGFNLNNRTSAAYTFNYVAMGN